MKRKEDLQELLATVKSGSPTVYSFALVYPAGGGPEFGLMAEAHIGSFDAALELLTTVLPDWKLTHAYGHGDAWTVCLSKTVRNKSAKRHYSEGKGENFGRAGLCAILEALIAEEDK